MDLIGHLGRDKEKKFILICIAHFLKWIKPDTIKSKTCVNLKDCSAKFASRFGGPIKKFIVESGRGFYNRMFRRACDIRGIKLQFASPKHHKTTGSLEIAINTYRNKFYKMTKNKTGK